MPLPADFPPAGFVIRAMLVPHTSVVGYVFVRRRSVYRLRVPEVCDCKMLALGHT